MSTFTSRDNSSLHNNKYFNPNCEIFISPIEVRYEMPHYISLLQGKKVYIPNTKKTVEFAECDAFVDYFNTTSAMNKFGIKELSYSYYDENENFVLITINGKNISRSVMNASNDESRLIHVMKQIDKVDVIIGSPEGVKANELIRYIYLSNKKFIFNINKLFSSYKIAHSMICDNVISFGYNIPKKFFNVKKGKEENRGDMMWITNFDNGFVPSEVKTWYDTKSYEYQKFDNYDAIAVDCIKMIPMDYKGVMGVPVTIIPILNLNQFEIVGFRKGNDGKDLRINGKDTHCRILIRFRD